MSKFKHEFNVDEKSGKTLLQVYIDGMKCDSFILDTKLSRRYLGLSLIKQDLIDVHNWIEKMNELAPESLNNSNGEIVYLESNNTNMSLLKALYFSSIISYGKCFVTSDGRKTRLEEKDHINPIYLDFHELIMEKRHGLVAHAGKFFDNGEVVISPHPNGHSFNIYPNLWRLDLQTDNNEEINFMGLVSELLITVENLINKAFEKLREDEVKPEVIKRRGF